MSGHDAAFDEALTAWLTHQATAEERLTSFAFREGQPAIELAPASSHAAVRRWLLEIVSGRDVAAFLASVDGAGRAMTALSDDGALGLTPGDRVAIAARVGVLAAAGLVARELETDRVALTALGRAALDASAMWDRDRPETVVTGDPR